MKRQLYIYLTAYLLLLGWRLLPEPAHGWLFFPVWVAATWMIFIGSHEAALMRRRAWLSQYLVEQSRYHRLLRGGVLLFGWHLALATLLALFMLVKLSLLSPWLWGVMLLNIPLLALIVSTLDARMRSHVKPRIRPALVRRIAVPLDAALMVLAYLAVALALTQPNLIGLSWNEAVTFHLPGSSSQLAVLAFFERAYLLADLTLQWALQNTLGDTDHSGWMALAGWTLLLLTSTAFIWAYVRLLVGGHALMTHAQTTNEETP